MASSSTSFTSDQEPDYEAMAAQKFKTFLKCHFKEMPINFRECYLDEAMSEGKVVILFLRDVKSDFFLLKFLLMYSSNLKVVKYINTNYVSMGWSMKNMSQSGRNVLITTLQNQSDIGDINTKTYALIMVPSGSYFVLKENDFWKQEVLLSVLEKKVEENYIKIIETMPSYFDFQQNILDKLGDRDYDSFEANELHYLKEKILFALFGPPRRRKGYDDACKETMEKIFDVICKESNAVSKYKNRIIISVIFNCTIPEYDARRKRMEENKYYDPEKDMTPRPIFVLRKCKGSKNPCRIFIDDLGRVYKKWDEYLQENKLEKCIMFLPKDGRYDADDYGRVILDRHVSPALSLSKQFMEFGDTVASVAGLGAGIIGIASTTVVAPVALAAVGISAGLYSAGRSIASIHDRRKHKQSVNISNSEARSDYINLAAVSLCSLGTGANAILKKLVSKGVQIGQGTKVLINGINVLNVAVNGVSILNSGYLIINQWQTKGHKPSKLAIAQLTISVLFFSHSVYNFKTANMIIDETQTKILQEYEASSRIHRFKKHFKRLTKKLLGGNGGDVQKSRTEIIKSFSNNADMKGGIRAVLKNLDKGEINCSIDNDQIKLNGVDIDMPMFNKTKANETTTFLPSFSNTENFGEAKVVKLISLFRRSFDVDLKNVSNLYTLVVNILNNPGPIVVDFIATVIEQLLKDLLGDSYVIITKGFCELIPSLSVCVGLLEIVIEWLNRKIEEIEIDYQQWQETKNLKLEKSYFHHFSENTTERLKQILQIVIKTLNFGKILTQINLIELIRIAFGWFLGKLWQKIRNKEVKDKREQCSVKVNCPDCKGYYYGPKTERKIIIKHVNF